jgi:AcrR family transcriptional regulator
MRANHGLLKQTEPARTFTASARRAQIVEVAIRVAAVAGYANTSFARIAREAGLSSTGIISYNFAGKDDLMRAVVAEVVSVAAAYVSPRVDAADGGRAKLRAYIEAHTAFLADHPNHLPALVEVVTNLPRDHADRAELLAQLEARNSVHAAYIAQAQAAAEFRDFDPQVMVVAVQGAIDALVMRKVRNPDLDVVACGRELADLFDHATRPH